LLIFALKRPVKDALAGWALRPLFATQQAARFRLIELSGLSMHAADRRDLWGLRPEFVGDGSNAGNVGRRLIAGSMVARRTLAR